MRILSSPHPGQDIRQLTTHFMLDKALSQLPLWAQTLVKSFAELSEAREKKKAVPKWLEQAIRAIIKKVNKPEPKRAFGFIT